MQVLYKILAIIPLKGSFRVLMQVLYTLLAYLFTLEGSFRVLMQVLYKLLAIIHT